MVAMKLSDALHKTITPGRGPTGRVCLIPHTVNLYLLLLLRTLIALPAPRGRDAIPDARRPAVSPVSAPFPVIAFSAPPGT